mgnify:CR=1
YRTFASDIIATSTGGFFVTWIADDYDASFDVWGRYFNSDGEPVGDEFMLHESYDGFQFEQRMTMLENGDIVTTYRDTDSDADSGARLAIQRFVNPM